MTRPAAHDSSGPAPALPGRRHPRRKLRLRLALAALALGLAAWLGWVVWLRVTAPDPPHVALDNMDPAIAQAIEAARTRVRDYPASAAAWGHLGMVLRAHAFRTGVRVCFEQAEWLDSRDPRWPYLLALTAQQEAADPAADSLPYLERAAALGGPVAAPRLKLAEVLVDLGRLDEAESHCQRVLEREAGNARAHFGLSRVALARGDPALSMKHLKRALPGAPKVRAVHVLLAEVHHRLGNKAEAEQALQWAADLKDDLDWSDPYLEEVVKLRVGVLARIEQAEYLSRQGRGPEAVALLQRTAAERPDSTPVYLALGRLHMRLGKAAEAAEAFRQAVRLDPRAAEIHFELGLALHRLGDHLAAADSFRAVTARQPEHALAHFHLGKCLEGLGDRVGAIAAYRDAVRHKAAYAPAQKMLGVLLAERGQEAEALAHLEQAARLGGLDPESQQLLERLRGGRPP